MFCYDLQGLSLMRIDINCSVFFFFFFPHSTRRIYKSQCILFFPGTDVLHAADMRYIELLP